MIQFIERISHLHRQWSCYRRVFRELETYSDRELEDLGLTRTGIRQLARQAAGMIR